MNVKRYINFDTNKVEANITRMFEKMHLADDHLLTSTRRTILRRLLRIIIQMFLCHNLCLTIVSS